MMYLRYWLLGSLAVAAGCSASHRPASNPAPKTSGNTSSQRVATPVRVDNQNFNDMNIYLVNGGVRWLIGHAGGLGQTTLTIPTSVAPADGRVRLEAIPIGSSRAIFTPELLVGPGQTVYWTIGSNSEMSTTSIG